MAEACSAFEPHGIMEQFSSAAFEVRLLSRPVIARGSLLARE